MRFPGCRSWSQEAVLGGERLSSWCFMVKMEPAVDGVKP